MTLRCLALALLTLTAATTARAQTPGSRTFQVIDGQVHLDGRVLPNAVPPSLDLSGFATGVLEFSGPVSPVVRVDDQVYVLENEKLVPMDESSQAGQGVYILGDISEEQMTPVVEAAYMRDVEQTDGSLYSKMQAERAMEAEALRLTERFHRLPPDSEERDRLRDQLRGLLSNVLELKHQVRREELDLAQSRLEAARSALDAREENHDAIVTRRLRDLTGQ